MDYTSTNELTSLHLLDIETAILDDLKQDFGHVPSGTCNHRIDLFQKKLSNVFFAFEPVVQLGEAEPEIHSWEALARDNDTQKAPVNLFKAAELWGPQFITELDIYCLQNATTEYAKLWEEEYHDVKPDPLAVNVYPDTLFRAAYKTELRRVVEEEIVKANRLVIEISEKRPIPTVDRIREHVLGYIDPEEEFVKKLYELASELQIGFAIDDFGVGHSSISRLVKLELDHIKIDRDILLHPHPECTIEYVKKIVNASHPHPIRIIVEGFDGDSRLTLKQLYELGVRYIQGHMIRKANLSVAGLSKEETEYIISELSGNDRS